MKTRPSSPKQTAAHPDGASDTSLQAAVGGRPVASAPTSHPTPAPAGSVPTAPDPARLRQPEYRPCQSPPWGEP
jgi:hypothetical protein